jgi:DNA-binding NarL/FixJ family response regulator
VRLVAGNAGPYRRAAVPAFGAPVPLRLLLVDDHVLFRQGLARLLARRKEVVVVGQADDAATGLEQAQRLHPDVVLMEVDLPGEDVAAAIHRLRAEQPQVVLVLLSVHDDAGKIVEAIKAGAQGYISKHARLPQLLGQLQALRRGEAAVPGWVAARLLDELRGQPVSAIPASVLTVREVEVLRLVAAQFTNKEIARRMLVSEHTVKNHVKHILGKLRVGSRRQAAASAIAWGWIDQPPGAARNSAH